MPGQLTVALAQPACVDLDLPANVAEHARLIRAAEARLVVFPELSLTGYDLTAPAVALDDERLAPITEACRETGSVALVCVALAEPDGTEALALLAFDGSEVSVVHRKMHLHGLENDRFVPGAQPNVLELDGRRIGLAICADVSFPEHAAKTAALGIDAYLGSTLYGDDEVAVQRRDSHVASAAAEHGVWGLMVNTAGPSGEYPATSGGSGFWAPGGALVTQAGPETGAILRHTI
ncbi:nitrilase [Kitasatospora sp. MMS16-BH015]|uniref:carbon-nitrogen hydrolase family protein n=1 Tax=Kitasatospora sp. MMS16-BH015 TaxID=2018025 RepID=UPI000CA3113A|nr:carbon-nitrogen hydrolase family protein [Kitasatospora sp. MMS16-BH015]AUG80796.1 nitrilase [Kitasatospora sp. MMS16-BH015]